MDRAEVSVVIPAHNEGENLADTVRAILDSGARRDFEVLVVDDGSSDGSGRRVEKLFGRSGRVSVITDHVRGVGQARNLGARRAEGEILIFLDAHCYTPPGWLDGLADPLEDPGVGLVGCGFADLLRDDGARGFGVTFRDASLETDWLGRQGDAPYAVPLLPGGCQAMRRCDFESFGEYEPGMSRWGSEGVEQSLRCWLMGLEVLVHSRVVVHHLFRERPTYEVDLGEVLYNRLRMAMLHFNSERATRVLDYWRAADHFSQAVITLLESDVMDRRRKWRERRRRDDDWFFERFGIQV
jgi:glycosyltransferase involved in cell wall biosynthesis